MAEPFRLVEPASGDPPPQLPHNVEAEAALLGALMIDNRLAEDVQLKLRPDHFFEPLHGRIYEALLRLIDRNMVASPVTLRPMFDADEAMRELGGPAYLAQLTGSGASLIGARDFATQIYDLALLRALIGVGRVMVEEALDTSQDVDPLGQIERAETELYKVAEEGGGEGRVKTFGQATKLAVEMAEKALNSGGHLSGVTTGLTDLNGLTGGFHKSDLIIIAGRPGMGKTSLATNIAYSAARRFIQDRQDGFDMSKTSGAVVAFFSLEMSADQLATRILAEQSEVPAELIRTGKLSRQEFQRFARVAGELEGLPFYIDDTAGLTIAGLRTRARRLKRQKALGMIVVDYLQLLQGTSKNSNDGRVQEISEISRGLKTLAKELNIPVIALSQLSRQVEQREDKKPQLSDLRESGSIEQDADLVVFIYREDYYHNFKRPEKPDEGSSTVMKEKYSDWERVEVEISGKTQIIVAKSRHGRTDSVIVRFDGQLTKFSDLVRDEQKYLPAPNL